MHLDIEGKLADEQELAKLLLGESYFLDDPEIIQQTSQSFNIVEIIRVNAQNWMLSWSNMGYLILRELL